MVGLLIASLVVGAAASAGAGILSRKNQRQQARKEAQYQIDTIAADTKTTLGTMQRELAVQKDADLKKANQIERSAIDDNTANMQSAYIEQLASESSHIDLIESSMQELGTASAQQGASGVRMDATLGSVMTNRANQQISQSRDLIDRTSKTQAGVGALNLAEARAQASEIRSQYDPGSAFMDLYHYKRSRVMSKALLDTAYYSGIKKDNEYNTNWFLADLFGVAGAAAGAVQGAYGAGIMGGSKGFA